MVAFFPAQDRCPLCIGPVQPVLHPEDPEPGHWCHDCALPSALLVRITVRCDHGWPSSLRCPAVLVCDNCGRQDKIPTAP